MHRRIVASMLAAASVTAIAWATLERADARPQREEQAQIQQSRADQAAKRQTRDSRRRSRQASRAPARADDFMTSGHAPRPTKRTRRKAAPAPSLFWQPEAKRYERSATRRTTRTTRARRPESRGRPIQVQMTAPNNFPVPIAGAGDRTTRAVRTTRRTDASVAPRTARTARTPRQQVRTAVAQPQASAPPNFPTRGRTATRQASGHERAVMRRTARTPRARREEARGYVAQGMTSAPPNFPTNGYRFSDGPVATAVRNSAAARNSYAYASVGMGRSELVAEARRWIGTNPTSRRTLWCARFMNFVLERTGHPGTGSDMARSFATYGRRVSGPQIGAIAVLSRGPRGGHVGIVSGIDENGNPILISGNHNNRVDEAPYPRQRVQVYVVPHS